jgi:RND family efflux transporter MFP subunit
MDRRRGLVRIGQVCLLLLAAWLLFHWWEARPPVIRSDDAVDDLIEEVGDTYVPVHVGEIERGTLRQYVTAYGTVEPASAIGGHDAASANVSSVTTGVVAAVECSEGQLVAKGAPLFMLDSRLVDSAIEQQRALAIADQAAVERMTPPAATQSTTKPSTQLSTQTSTRPWWAINAQRQLAADDAAMDQLVVQRDSLKVTAPLAGTITNLNIAAGEIVDSKKIAVQIIDLDRLVAAVDVPPEGLADLRAGQLATIDLRSTNSSTQPATQPSPMTGNIVLVDPTINPATGMGSADIAIPSGSALRPGQFVRAQIVAREETDRLMVPTQSITQNQNGDPAVGRVETDGRWSVLVPVRTGRRDGDKIEIEGQGLDAGQQIVTTGANGLVQRTRLHLLKD